MKKTAIAVVALPLTCLGAGYAAGLAFIAPPEAAISVDAAQEDLPAEPADQLRDTSKEHATDTHVDDNADAGADVPASYATPELEDMDPYALAADRTIIRLGQMTIPVEKQTSISYVVADFALRLKDLETAERYKRVKEATRLRDSLLTAMNRAAESTVLRGVSIDSDALSSMLVDMLSETYEGITDVLFVSLYKQDVARL